MPLLKFLAHSIDLSQNGIGGAVHKSELMCQKSGSGAKRKKERKKDLCTPPPARWQRSIWQQGKR